MKRMTMIAAVCIALLSGAGAAYGSCLWNGHAYPVGAVVGSLVCTPAGWAPRGG
jgi:hypothetical protein